MMTEKQKKQVVGALEQYMQEHGLSQNEVAKRTGVNVAYIVAMRKGEYSVTAKGKEVEIADKHFEKIAEFIGLEVKQTFWKVQPTEQLVEIIGILEDAREYGYTNTIVGDTGCGKTHAIELFRQKFPADTFVVTVSQLDKIGDILDKILDAMKLPEAKGNAKKMKTIIGKLIDLKRDGRKPTLILDECEYMKQPALCAIKEFYDGLHRACAIVMVGHHQLINNIERLRRKSKDGIPQLYRRIKFGIRTLAPIDRSYTLFLEGIEDKALRKFLQRECDNYGELHDVLVPAQREAERTGEPLTEDLVKKIFNIR